MAALDILSQPRLTRLARLLCPRCYVHNDPRGFKLCHFCYSAFCSTCASSDRAHCHHCSLTICERHSEYCRFCEAWRCFDDRNEDCEVYRAMKREEARAKEREQRDAMLAIRAESAADKEETLKARATSCPELRVPAVVPPRKSLSMTAMQRWELQREIARRKSLGIREPVTPSTTAPPPPPRPPRPRELRPTFRASGPRSASSSRRDD